MPIIEKTIKDDLGYVEEIKIANTKQPRLTENNERILSEGADYYIIKTIDNRTAFKSKVKKVKPIAVVPLISIEPIKPIKLIEPTPIAKPVIAKIEEIELEAAESYYCKKCKRTHMKGSKIYNKHLEFNIKEVNTE